MHEISKKICAGHRIRTFAPKVGSLAINQQCYRSFYKEFAKKLKIICKIFSKLIEVKKKPLGVLKKVIVSQRNFNQIACVSILQFGENYGFGRKINESYP